MLYEHTHKQTRVFDTALNSIETEILREVILRGTGRGARDASVRASPPETLPGANKP